MKKKFLSLFAIVTLLSLAIAAYAYTQNSTTAGAAASSCCKDKDSCPMKGKMKHGEGGEHAKMDCCKKNGGENAKGDCCGDSCPMKKGEGTAQGSEGKSCCDDCDCCKDKAKSAAAI